MTNVDWKKVMRFKTLFLIGWFGLICGSIFPLCTGVAHNITWLKILGMSVLIAGLIVTSLAVRSLSN